MKTWDAPPKKARKNEPTKPARTRRGKGSRTRSRRKSGRLIWGLVVLSLMVVGGWVYLKVAPIVTAWATVQRISVLGIDRVQREEVVTLLDLPQKVSLFALNQEGLEERVETHPWVAAASIERIFPDTLAISITEREAVAILQSPEGSHFLDDRGYLLSAAPGDQFPSLPRVKGVTPVAFEQNGESVRKQVRTGIQVASLLAGELQAVPTVNVVHQSTIVADLPDVRFQFGSLIEDQWQRFRALYPSIQKRMSATPQEVDLRYPGKVILRERK